MADLNRVFLMGRLTRDPELRRTPNGTAVAELGLATSRSWTGRDGDRKEETLFIDVTVWDRQAETCCQYLKKGSGIHVEGSLRMDTWEDKTTGEKRSKVRVHADRVQFLDRREPAGMNDEEFAPREAPTRRPSSGGYEPRGGGGGSNGPGPSRGFPNAGAGGSAPRRPAPEPDAGGDDDEDIPF
ncbi:MAG: single-stranded DNA-binding protein [Isosphaeraceae bacterium]